MKRTAAYLVVAFGVALALAACSQTPGVRFDPVGTYQGTMYLDGETSVPLTVVITAAGGGWRAEINSGSTSFTPECARIGRTNELVCVQSTALELATWEGPVTPSGWTGVWDYAGPSDSFGGTFEFERQ